MRRSERKKLESAVLKARMKLLSREDRIKLIEHIYGSDIRAICRHESSHAVTTLAVGNNFDSVRIFPEALVESIKYVAKERREKPLESALVCLVGPASDMHVQQKFGWKSHPGGNEDDFVHANSCAMSTIRPSLKEPLFSGANPDGVEVSITDQENMELTIWMIAAKSMAYQIVDFFSPWIIKVSDHLFKETVLSKDRVKELCSDLPSLPDLKKRHEKEMNSIKRYTKENHGL